jgi:uncharacterized membrane protein YqjE
MSSESPGSRNPTGHSGLLGSALALISTAAEFFETRFALLAKESRSAAVQMLILITSLVVAMALSVMGYVFLVVSAIVGLAYLLGTSWPWVALMVAVLHFIIALVCLLIARSRITKPLFRATLDELKKDREWLKNLNQSTS